MWITRPSAYPSVRMPFDPDLISANKLLIGYVNDQRDAQFL